MLASAAYSSCCTAACIAFVKPAACLRLTRAAFNSVMCMLGGRRDTTATPACSRALMHVQLQHSTYARRLAPVQPDAEALEFGGDNVHEHHVAAEPADAGVRERLLWQAGALLLENLQRIVSKPRDPQQRGVLAWMSCCNCCGVAAITARETCILSSGTKDLDSPGKQDRRSSHTANEGVSARWASLHKTRHLPCAARARREGSVTRTLMKCDARSFAPEAACCAVGLLSLLQLSEAG